jgi:hypothetical protein
MYQVLKTTYSFTLIIHATHNANSYWNHNHAINNESSGI